MIEKPNLTDLTTEIDKRNSYASMFNRIGFSLRNDSLKFRFSHPYDIDARFESSFLKLYPMPFDENTMRCVSCNTSNVRTAYECKRCGFEFGFST